MNNILGNVIRMSVKHSIANGANASTICQEIDSFVIGCVIDYCRRNSDFHVYKDYIEKMDLGKGETGTYCKYTGEVIISRYHYEDVIKLVCIGTSSGEDLLRRMVRTILHEHRHAKQHKCKFPETKIPYIQPEEDYQAYYNHPMEVDAREIAEYHVDDALAYIIGKMRIKYLP